MPLLSTFFIISVFGELDVFYISASCLPYCRTAWQSKRCYFPLGQLEESWHQEPVVCNSLSNCSLWLSFHCFSLLFLTTLFTKWHKTFPCLVVQTNFYWRKVTAAAEAFFFVFFCWHGKFSIVLLLTNNLLTHSVYSNVKIRFWNEVFLLSRVA